jgi:hypothetical protein
MIGDNNKEEEEREEREEEGYNLETDEQSMSDSPEYLMNITANDIANGKAEEKIEKAEDEISKIKKMVEEGDAELSKVMNKMNLEGVKEEAKPLMTTASDQLEKNKMNYILVTRNMLRYMWYVSMSGNDEVYFIVDEKKKIVEDVFNRRLTN